MSSVAAAAASGAAADTSGGEAPKPAPLKRTRWSKPKKGKTAYNYFFQEERLRILAEKNQDDHGGSKGQPNGVCVAGSLADTPKEEEKNKPHGKISIQELSREISRRWKLVSVEDLARYDAMANEDAKRYQDEMKEYETEKMAAFYMLQSNTMAKRNPPTKCASMSGGSGASGESVSQPPVHVSSALASPAVAATGVLSFGTGMHDTRTIGINQQPLPNNMNAMYQPLPTADQAQSLVSSNVTSTQAQHYAQALFPNHEEQRHIHLLHVPGMGQHINFQIPSTKAQLPFATSHPQPTVASVPPPPTIEAQLFPGTCNATSTCTQTQAQALLPNQGQQHHIHMFSGIDQLSESQAKKILKAILSSQTLPSGLPEITSPSSNFPPSLSSLLSSSPPSISPVSHQRDTSLPSRSGDASFSMASAANASAISSLSTTTKTESTISSIGGRRVCIHHHNHYVTISEETGEIEALSSSSSSSVGTYEAVMSTSQSNKKSSSSSKMSSRSSKSIDASESGELSSMSTLTSIKLSIPPQKDDSSISDVSASRSESKHSNIEAVRLLPKKRRSPSSSASVGKFSSTSSNKSGLSNNSSSSSTLGGVCGAKKRAKFDLDTASSLLELAS